MKLINIITHPVLVIIAFSVILVSGEHFGGLYLMYLLMALPHGGIHEVLALLGTGLILFSYAKYKRESQFFFKMVLNILGVFSLYTSLWLFSITVGIIIMAPSIKACPSSASCYSALSRLGFWHKALPGLRGQSLTDHPLTNLRCN